VREKIPRRERADPPTRVANGTLPREMHPPRVRPVEVPLHARPRQDGT
jgi:hypothetical protein